MKRILLALGAAIILPSCSTTHTSATLGYYRETYPSDPKSRFGLFVERKNARQEILSDKP